MFFPQVCRFCTMSHLCSVSTFEKKDHETSETNQFPDYGSSLYFLYVYRTGAI
jgi:hypothetical protein